MIGRDEEPDDCLCVLVAMHVAVAVMSAPRCSMTAPLQCPTKGDSSGFIPAMPENDMQVILRALHNSGESRYAGNWEEQVHRSIK